MPTKLQIRTALEHLGFLIVRLYSGHEGVERWAAIRPFANGFAIGTGDLQVIHNELWWYPTLPLAKEALNAWETGVGSPPAASHTSPRCIAGKGKLKRWNDNGRT